MDDDGGMQWWVEVGQQEEYEAWLADKKAQDEYRKFSETIDKEKQNEVE